ncbi:hypothetical protein [Sphingomonas nostoxanthinifaciens]|uniref:hypothetical protein n=1 Tax=Sphingomonas nostoxanthinifaciens TaxID=2872652 RepID=UPI001CC20CA1|nr:hypothetical protein [Sphingomonas nostoxanthinifaciens]UAK25139.1 hypothetical protein K8P63_02735 [Sphingomonas nostoxanthinifaciens]
MRHIIKKTSAAAMVVAAALAVSACGKSETTNVSENVSMTDMNAEGSMNDMSATDMNATDTNMADNSMMGSNTSNME